MQFNYISLFYLFKPVISYPDVTARQNTHPDPASTGIAWQDCLHHQVPHIPITL